MTPPDMQYFEHSAWWVKPQDAVVVDVVLCGAGAGATGLDDGEDGNLSVQRHLASDLPDQVLVTVGKGGRPGGRDGYALIITHLIGSGAENQ